MLIQLLRISTTPESTIGALYIDGQFSCYTLEDTRRFKKVKGETRIPDGRYQVVLRTEGTLHSKYQERYSFHRGMLWLRDVPGFEYVYIHTGNTKAHTAGCILVGDTLQNNTIKEGFVGNSRQAYERVYEDVAGMIEPWLDPVWIQVSSYA